MGTTIALETLFNNDNVYYLGESFYVTVEDRRYAFFKGYLDKSPKSYNHPLYSIKAHQCAAYVLHDMSSGKKYIGSSERVYVRVGKHKWRMLKKNHPNSNFNDLLKTTQLKNFELIVIFTDTRDEAYALEQLLINRFKSTGTLINIALDVRYAMLGQSLTDERRQKISSSNTGKVMSLESKARMSAFHKTDEKAILQFKEILQAKRRRVLVDSVEYESLTQAAKESGKTESNIRKLLADDAASTTRWLTDNASPLTGRQQSKEQREKQSLFRKTNSQAKAQLAAASAKVKKAILLNDVLYSSVLDAAAATGIAEWDIHKQLKKCDGKAGNGPYVLNYVHVKHAAQKIKMGGVVYDSILAASKMLSISANTLKSRIRSGKAVYLRS